MANWRYTLEIKDLLTDDGPDADYDGDAVKNAPEAASRVRALMKKITLEAGEAAGFDDAKADMLNDLAEALDEVADTFDEVATTTDSPKSTFNEALEILYNVGDDGHMIWIK